MGCSTVGRTASSRLECGVISYIRVLCSAEFCYMKDFDAMQWAALQWGVLILGVWGVQLHQAAM